MKQVVFEQTFDTVRVDVCNVTKNFYGIINEGKKHIFTADYAVIDPRRKFLIVIEPLSSGSTSASFERLQDIWPNAQIYEFDTLEELTEWLD